MATTRTGSVTYGAMINLPVPQRHEVIEPTEGGPTPMNMRVLVLVFDTKEQCATWESILLAIGTEER